jgi:hypothetical protein
MKEAIEQVVAELERCKVIDEKIDDWNHGWNSALKMTLLKLKAVLANGENDSSREAWEQSPEYKRFAQRTKEVKHETSDTRHPSQPERNDQRQQA